MNFISNIKYKLKRSLTPSMRRELLYKKKIDEFNNIQGWLSLSEAVHLYYFAKKCPSNSTIVEIGSWKGKSTFCLAKGCNNGLVYAIDPFDCSGDIEYFDEYNKLKGIEDLHTQFTNNMSRNNLINRVIPLKGYSHNYINKFENIDLLFIDANHNENECKYDYENYNTKIRKGGILAFHDYYPDKKNFGVTHVVDNVVVPSNKYKFLGLYDSLWVAKKK